jgi:acetamidase/formamidase
MVETELCSGPWLKDETDQFELAKIQGVNPAVVIAVAGARPGDCLAVEIMDIEPDRLGYTGFIYPANPLSRQILGYDLDRNTRTLVIEDGHILWSEDLRLPVKPMIGTLGTAPAAEELLNSKGGPHGGNMDVQELAAGCTVYLPVAVPEALLHVADVHALQGDGEINLAGGVECRAKVTLKASICQRFSGLSGVRLENSDYIMTVACERTVESSFHTAAREMVRWLAAEYGFLEKDAYLLMGQLLEARCTQFVNPTSTYICKMPKRYLP